MTHRVRGTYMTYRVFLEGVDALSSRNSDEQLSS